MSVAEISARIEVIRGHLGLPTARTTTTSGTGFASSLASALGTLDPSGTTGVGSTVSGTAVVDGAKKYLGVPYVFGGTDPASGLDCSGLVQRVYRDLGVDLPRIAKDQARAGSPVAGLAQARPGDLLAFNTPVDHIAIYIGNNQMIAAPRPGDHVKIQPVYETPTAIRRILPDASGASAGGAGAFATAAALRPGSLTSTFGVSATNPSAGAGPVPFANLFQAAGAKYGIPAGLLAAVARVESNYNPSATSRAGAQGLMQIMPGTARGLGVDALDPAQAVDGAARLLKANLKQFNNSLPLALAAYNAGGGAVQKYGGIPPYAETQAYVPKVQAAMAELARKGFA